MGRACKSYSGRAATPAACCCPAALPPAHCSPAAAPPRPGAAAACLQFADGCIMCSQDASSCAACDRGYVLKAATGTCEQCSAPGTVEPDLVCVKCAAANSSHCLQCELTWGELAYVDTQGACGLCPPNSAACTGPNGMATRCAAGYHLAATGTCEPCGVPNCSSCPDVAGKCSLCQLGYSLDDSGACVDVRRARRVWGSPACPALPASAGCGACRARKAVPTYPGSPLPPHRPFPPLALPPVGSVARTA